MPQQGNDRKASRGYHHRRRRQPLTETTEVPQHQTVENDTPDPQASINTLYPIELLIGYDVADTLFHDDRVHDAHNTSQEGLTAAPAIEDGSYPHQDASTSYNYLYFASPDVQDAHRNECQSETTLAQSSMGNDSTLVDGNDQGQNYAPPNAFHEDSDNDSRKVFVSSSPRSTYSALSDGKHNIEFNDVDVLKTGSWADSPWPPTFDTSFEQN